MFIETTTVYKSGVHLQVKITTKENKEIFLDGKVQWAKKAPPRYAHKLRSGMGVTVTRFTEGKELFHDFCPREACINCTPLLDEEQAG